MIQKKKKKEEEKKKRNDRNIDETRDFDMGRVLL